MFEGLFGKTKINDAKPGKVCTIQGEIQAKSSLTFPLSSSPCVYFTVFMEKYGKGARGSGRPLWFPDKIESKSIAFTVSDGEHEMTIQEQGERMTVRGAAQEQGLVRGNKKRRYFASLLKEGDRVTIRGMVDGAPGHLTMAAPPGGVIKVKVTRRAA